MAGFDFAGKTVWVTGTGKGIGYTTVLALTNAGAEAAGFDREFPQDNYPLATEVPGVANAGQVAEMYQRVFKVCERLDVLVDAAGILRIGVADALGVKGWQQTFAVNAGGTFDLFQQTMAQFRCQQGGAVMIAALDAAYTPHIGMSTYGASKAALKSLTLTVGLELAGSGVRCGMVSSGSIDTNMQHIPWVSDDVEQQRIHGFGEQLKLGIPLGKVAQSQEIINTILFLAPNLASHITLQDTAMDGGSTLGI